MTKVKKKRDSLIFTRSAFNGKIIYDNEHDVFTLLTWRITEFDQSVSIYSSNVVYGICGLEYDTHFLDLFINQVRGTGACSKDIAVLTVSVCDDNIVCAQKRNRYDNIEGGREGGREGFEQGDNRLFTCKFQYNAIILKSKNK